MFIYKTEFVTHTTSHHVNRLHFPAMTFATVMEEVLLNCMTKFCRQRSFSVTGKKSRKWLYDYTTKMASGTRRVNGRQFRIKINDTFSSFRPITAGVPQGSILSPMLFNVYTYDIPKVPRGELALYADDTTIFAKSMNLTQLVKYLQEGLDLYSNWARDWGISVNPSKSQAMLFTNKMQRNPTVKFQGANLPWQKEVKYLGVILDRTLSWGPNTTNSIKKAKAAVSAITPILKTLP